MKTQKHTQSIRLVVKPRFKKMVLKHTERLGINMSTYIKHLIISDIQRIPSYEASERIKRNVEKSISDK
jgi:hypothetical protein